MHGQLVDVVTPANVQPRGIAAYLRRSVNWWSVLALIVVAGGLLRFTGYNFALPYIDTSDEPTYLVGTLYVRGLYNQPFRLPGYPPGIFWVYSAAQVLIGSRLATAIRLNC